MPPPSRTDQYASKVRQVRERIIAFLTQLWGQLPDYRDQAVEDFIGQAITVVLSGERLVSELTHTYLTDLMSEMIGDSVPPVVIPPGDVTGESLRGVPPETVYYRPFTQLWTDLSNGVPFPEARARGEQRLRSLAETDLQLAKTHTARKVLTRNADKVTGYERVLNGDENCALCVVASTQRYHVENLMPIHPGCDCGVKPLTRKTGQVIHEERLDQVHDAIRERIGIADRGGRRVDYRKLVITQEHGEYGPTLALSGMHFDGPKDVRPTRAPETT